MQLGRSRSLRAAVSGRGPRSLGAAERNARVVPHMTIRHSVHVTLLSVALALGGCAGKDRWTVRRAAGYSIDGVNACAALHKAPGDKYALDVMISPAPPGDVIHGRDVSSHLVDAEGLHVPLLPEQAADSRVTEVASGPASIAHIRYRFRSRRLEFPLQLRVEYRARIYEMLIRGVP